MSISVQNYKMFLGLPFQDIFPFNLNLLNFSQNVGIGVLCIYSMEQSTVNGDTVVKYSKILTVYHRK